MEVPALHQGLPACVASIDDNVGRLLDYLEEEGLAENTIVVYTSDQASSSAITAGMTNALYEESLVCRS